jgi:Lamin Tail Domain
MEKIKKINLLILGVLFSFAAKAQLTTGDIAFTGFNADSTDHLAFVTFVEIPANTVIYLQDNEWTGAAFNTGEGSSKWTSGPTAIPSGTIVLLNQLADSVKRSANFGALSGGVVAIGATNEGVYAFTGTDATTPTKFLTAIFNGLVINAGTGSTLTGTNLEEGATAIILTAGVDIAAYKGTRASSTKEGFLSELGKIATNWDSQDGGGDQSSDGIMPDIPFSTQAFVVSNVDNLPPSVSSALFENATTIKVTFGERVTKATAENKANYAFAPAMTVASVAYDSASKKATLTLTGFQSGTKYKLTSNGFTDLSGNTQTVAVVTDNLIFNTYTGSDIVITEIMYNLGGADSLEFIEIYNKSNANIAIGGMQLSGVVGTLPELSIGAKKAVVLASDSFRFSKFYGVTAVYDWLSGSLDNSGESIAIQNSLGGIVDSLTYDDVEPWYPTTDGKGYSIEIINANNDNAVATNWRASVKSLNKTVSTTDTTKVFCSPGVVDFSSPVSNVISEATFDIFPNPAGGEIVYFTKEISGMVMDLSGKIVARFDNKSNLNVRTFPNGLYILKTVGWEKKFVIQR